MTKKAIIIVNLENEAYRLKNIQIEKMIRKRASIPWCKEIEKVSIDDIKTTYYDLKKQGIAKNVAKSIIKLYTE